jgi:hypothetical protein
MTLMTKVRKNNSRNPTLKEKVKIYEWYLEEISNSIQNKNLNKLKKLVQNADTWMYIKNTKIKGISNKAKKDILNKAFWSLLSCHKN